MGCDDYNLHLEGSEGNESPTPEYKIYLDGVGVNGYSPTVDIVNENTASFQIQTNDINGSELTSPIPKLSYLQSNYVSNTSLASTLANYSTTSEIASDYLKVDGSNADNPITINNIKIEPMTLSSINSSLYLQAGNGSIVLTPSNGQKVYYTPYNTSVSNKYEVAVRDDISDDTITITQGGVIKGTFTLNGSATTIDLDAGGSTITNPLHIGYTQGLATRNINLGLNETTSKIISSYTLATNGASFAFPIYLLGDADNPLVLTEDERGSYTIGLNIDDDTIKVNQDGKLYAVGGGGGTTYTAGTGIDITNDTISIDTSVVAQLSDIPDVSNFLETSDITTGTTNGTIAVGSTDIAVKGLDSAAYTPTTDYMTVAGDQVGTDKYITGNKQFHGTVYLSAGKVIIQNNNNTQNIGLINNTSDLQVSTYSNKNIKFTPNGTGKLYYGNNEIATINDIPSLTNYVTNTDYATTSVGGVVKVDGSTITVSNGVISATPARNIGETVHSLVPLTDAGLHLLDGSLIQGSGSYADFVTYISGLVNSYPNLFVTESAWQTSVTTYGVCGKFVYDNVNNTVRLPKITGIIEGTIDVTALGDLVQAGLPNITGTFGANFTQGNLFNRGSGAFGGYRDNTINTTVPQDSTVPYSTNNMWDFDASRSSSIYGNSSTVQPQTIKAFIYIVIATSAKTDIQVDIDEIATDLNGKADKDLSNITTVSTQITTTAINPLINKLTNADTTVAPSSDIDTGILFKDVNDNNLAGFTTTRFTNGVQAASMSAINNISGTSKTAYINVYVDSGGNDHSDASAGVKSSIANWAMPTTTSYPVAFDASGHFTASQNGYLVVSVKVNTPSGFYLNNTSNGLSILYTAPYAGWDVNGFIPIAAGQTASIYIVDGYVNAGFPKFIPCIGG